ncbi:MAG: phosphoglycerate dehydrogenase [Rhodospirillales bacterium]|jgi:D-3-phosphoglycerate dehydrogenase|nr:phosphoglycerate dehydrogenase [Rhodospirillales bacterium]
MSAIANRPRVLVTANFFGESDPRTLQILKDTGAEIILKNDRGITEDEVAEFIKGVDALVAGVEPITPRVMDAAPGLKLIARVGVGYDSVDVAAARARGIHVTHSPEGPWPGVAELTVGLMIDLLRWVGQVDREVRRGNWRRMIGRRLAMSTIGIVGVGRIGKAVIRHAVNGFPGVRVLANDLAADLEFGKLFDVEWVDKEQLYREADVISLHVPKTRLTRNLIDEGALALMKPTSSLINTARGGIVDETALAEALRTGRLAGAAIDVFDQEPYDGPLLALENCILTPHIAGNTTDCRIRMEADAANEVRRLLAGAPPAYPVPEEED